MRIIHISDLHICTKFRRKNISKAKTLFKKILEEDFDHLVVTGDVSDNAQEVDFSILRNILQKNGLYDRNKTSIVIGNHDIFGGVQTAQDVIDFPQRCQKVNYYEAIKKFQNNFKDLFEDVYNPIREKHYPYFKQVGDYLFIGLNSIDYYTYLRNPLASNGKINKLDYLITSETLKKPEYISLKKIVMVHHQFCKFFSYKNVDNTLWTRIEKYTMQLRKKKRLMKMFEDENVSFVLHGHLHEMMHYESNGVEYVNAGGSLDSPYENEVRYNLIDIDDDKIKIEIKSYDYKEIFTEINV